MKKILLIVITIAGALHAAYAQYTCGSDITDREQKALHPGIAAQEAAFRAGYRQYLAGTDLQSLKASPATLGKATRTYIIPVVVHVLHNNGAENISDARIRNEIAIMNQCYSATTPFMDRLRPVFQDIAANTHIEFRLAQRDPNGNCTNGINRIITPFTNRANDDLKKLICWDPTSYLNIWVVGNIVINSSFPVGGYAYKPIAYPGMRYDGLMIMAATVGNVSASPDQRNTASHEVGHYLGLDHPFAGDSCDVHGDGVDDTPPTYFTPDANTSSRKCCDGAQPNTCSSDDPDLPDQYENIMDYYTGANAGFIFTLGQAALMHYTLDHYRNSLCDSPNLVRTGVLQPALACGPKALFNIKNRTEAQLSTCTGSGIQFIDNSYNGDITSWEWSFGEGATPATASGKVPPMVSYSTAGDKTVTLTVSGPGGSNTRAEEQYIHISDAANVNPGSVVYADWDYQNNFLRNGWSLIDPSDAWVRTGDAKYEGSHSMLVDAKKTVKGYTYSLLSPSFDFSSVPSPYLSFYYSFAPNLAGGKEAASKKDLITYDALEVFSSVDCGQTWKSLRRIGPPAGSIAVVSNPLNTANVALASINTFVPVNQSQWSQVLVNSNIPQAANVRFKISFTSQQGNNFFLDNLASGISTGVGKISEKEIGLDVVPNPTGASQGFAVSFDMPETAPLEVRLRDITGRTVATLYSGTYPKGPFHVEVQPEAFGIGGGIYLLSVQMKEREANKKVVVRK